MALNFTASIVRNIERVQQEINDKVHRISIELFLLIVSKTPSPAFPGKYAKGVLANQWYPKVGGFSEEKGSDTSHNGQGSRNRITSLRGGREFLDKDNTITLTNNLDYAYRAEVLGWPGAPEGHWSGNVGPYRMVALSLQEIAARYPK